MMSKIVEDVLNVDFDTFVKVITRVKPHIIVETFERIEKPITFTIASLDMYYEVNYDDISYYDEDEDYGVKTTDDIDIIYYDDRFIVFLKQILKSTSFIKDTDFIYIAGDYNDITFKFGKYRRNIIHYECRVDGYKIKTKIDIENEFSYKEFFAKVRKIIDNIYFEWKKSSVDDKIINLINELFRLREYVVENNVKYTANYSKLLEKLSKVFREEVLTNTIIIKEKDISG